MAATIPKILPRRSCTARHTQCGEPLGREEGKNRTQTNNKQHEVATPHREAEPKSSLQRSKGTSEGNAAVGDPNKPQNNGKQKFKTREVAAGGGGKRNGRRLRRAGKRGRRPEP